MAPDDDRRGNRDNGLRCGNYVAVADLDPRVVDSLLSALRDEGIAAYAEPTPAATGGYLEARLPSRPIDRLWVDDQQVDRARALVAATGADDAAAGGDLDFDAAWQGVVDSLRADNDDADGKPLPPWPVSEDLDVSTGSFAGAEPSSGPIEPDEHFVPPPPPPLPKLRPATVLAVVCIVVGMLMLVTNFADGDLDVIAVLAIVGGAVSLVWHMRQGPPTDSGWDDGAVV